MKIRCLRHIKLIGMILLIGLAAACAGKTIHLSPDRYRPSFSAADFTLYKGKQIYLYRIAHYGKEADRTRYRSDTAKNVYELTPPSLEVYLWSCFKKGFEHAGITVWEQGASARVPIVQVNLNAITDRTMAFEVILKKDGSRLYQKTLIVKGDWKLLGYRAGLEQEAYGMLDRSIATLLKDADFQKVFLSAS